MVILKKRGIIITVASVACAAIIAALVQYGYIEYLLDSRKIAHSNKSNYVVVTLSIGPNSLLKKPYNSIVQIKFDKTITENTFRVIRLPYNWFVAKDRTYDDIIIKGKTRTLSDNEYDTLLEALRNSDFESIQREIDNILVCDGNSTYITVREDDVAYSVGGPSAEYIDKRFKDLMDNILELLE